MKKQYPYILLCLTCLVLIGGCSGPKPSDPRHRYLLEVERPGQSQESDDSINLSVKPFVLSPGVDGEAFVYRLSAAEYEADYYNQFITPVGRQVSEQVRQWLSRSGCFGRVLLPGSRVSATHVLEGNICKLYGDFQDKADAEAVMEIQVYLADVRTGKARIIFDKRYRASSKMPEATAATMTTSYGECLKTVLQAMEDDLKQINMNGEL
jgi:cholesterol transport system auxiliary component